MIKDKNLIKTRVALIQVGDEIKLNKDQSIKVSKITNKHVYFEHFNNSRCNIEDGRAHKSWFYVNKHKEIGVKQLESNINSLSKYIIIKFKKNK